MAIDFPATPSVGTIFTAAGASWRWNGVKWVAATAPGPAVITNDVGRNLVHNPLFNISQRTGPWTVTGYTADRWLLLPVLDTASVSLQALAPGGIPGDESATAQLVNGFIGNAGATALTVLAQPIEDIRRLAGKTVTVSFYAVASVAATKFGVNLEQNFGTGGSPSAQVTGAGQSVALTTGWARYSLTFTVPSIAGKALGTNGNHNTTLNLWYSSGANYATRSGSVGVQSATVYLWGVQLEIGSVATPLEKPDPQQDLAKCQRFYQSLGAVSWGVVATGSGQYFAGTWLLPVSMRATPTLVFSGTTYNNSSGIAANGIYPNSVNAVAISSAAGSAFCTTYLILSADL